MKYIQTKFVAIFILFLSFFCSPILSQIDESVYLDIVKSETSSNYYVGFYARKGFPGHVYTIFGSYTNNQCKLDHAVGYYPKGDKPDDVVFGTPSDLVSGVLINENMFKPSGNEDDGPTSLQKTSHKVVLKVDKLVYDKGINVIQKYADQPDIRGDYNLITRNCIDVLAEISNEMSFNIESELLFPQIFIGKLIVNSSPVSIKPLKLDDEFIISYPNGTYLGSNIGGSLITGNGTFNFSENNDNVRYTGELLKGMPHGKGTMYHKNYKISGAFKNGVIDGEFIMISEFKGNILTTSGKLNNGLPSSNEFYSINCNCGWTYNGKLNKWLNPNGQGHVNYVDGKKLYAHFNNGAIEGEVKVTNPDGSFSTYIVKNGNIVLNSLKLFDINGRSIQQNQDVNMPEDSGGRLLMELLRERNDNPPPKDPPGIQGEIIILN